MLNPVEEDKRPKQLRLGVSSRNRCDLEGKVGALCGSLGETKHTPEGQIQKPTKLSIIIE